MSKDTRDLPGNAENEGSTIDVTEIEKINAEMQANFNSVRDGEELVVVVGMTGVGKSTTVNYLLGDEIEVISRTSGGTKYAVKDESSASAKIGYGRSETTFPRVYPVEDSSVKLADTAGYGDTRGIERQIGIAAELTRLSKKAKIKGIVLVVNKAAITDNRGLGIQNLINTLRQLTSELSANRLVFCVTSVGVNDPVIDDSAIIREILKAVKESSIDPMREELAKLTRLKAEDRERRLQVIEGLEFMTPDNMFVMERLEDTARQDQVRRKLFAYIETMPVLTKAFRLVLEPEAQAELRAFSREQAKQAVAQLKEIEQANIDHVASKKTLEEVCVLERRLTQADRDSRAAAQRVEKATLTERKLTAVFHSLIDAREDNTSILQPISIPLPKAGFGVSGVISYQVTATSAERFESVKPLTKDVSVTKHGVGYAATISRVVTDREAASELATGVELEYKNRNLEGFNAFVEKTRRAQEHLVVEVPKLIREKEKKELELSTVQARIRGEAVDTLGLPLRSTDDVDQLVNQLRSRGSELVSVAKRCELRKTQAEAAVEPHRKSYEFLNKVIPLAELKGSSIVAFTSQYAAYQASLAAVAEQSPDRAEHNEEFVSPLLLRSQNFGFDDSDARFAVLEGVEEFVRQRPEGRAASGRAPVMGNDSFFAEGSRRDDPLAKKQSRIMILEVDGTDGDDDSAERVQRSSLRGGSSMFCGRRATANSAPTARSHALLDSDSDNESTHSSVSISSSGQ